MLAAQQLRDQAVRDKLLGVKMLTHNAHASKVSPNAS